MPNAEPKLRNLDLARIEQAFLSKHHVWEFWSSDKCPASLVEFLGNALPHLDPCSWGERMLWGGIFINGLPVKKDGALNAPCRIEYYEPKFDLKRAQDFFPAWNSKFILYQDSDVLVVFKPPKLASVPSRDQSEYNLKTYLEKHLNQTVHMPSRLDLSTSGLMLVSLNPAINKSIQKMFERRLLDKYYLLEISEKPDWNETTVEAAIGRDKRHPVLRKVLTQRGKPACTKFFSLEISQRFFLVAKPLTGRTHQIRVHAESLGFPILGDNFYGGKVAESLRLFSYRLKFPHPRGNRTLDIKAPIELAPVWSRAALSFSERIS